MHLADHWKPDTNRRLACRLSSSPEGYPGEYLLDIAKDIAKEFGEEPLAGMRQGGWNFWKQAVERIVATRKPFSKVRIKFDRWFQSVRWLSVGDRPDAFNAF